ncbi:hypothetical protein KUTeg_007785 [Tegillarca granosa]|uniref:Uncharacterized protein n=1 Tax=Tegillarca granosa TaxID=220873 RepID=A0ABQ9FE96_TEGGR|nr:hypothetical protein KUTeg_007785 [Tegillarca granosa]
MGTKEYSTSYAMHTFIGQSNCVVFLNAQTRDDYKGPVLGPKMADKNVREFTEEQLEAGKYVHSLQYGSNQGASQAGINMGKQRMIND